jgi:hypothetical protein
LAVRIKYPQGLSFTLYKLDTRGFAALDDGVTGKHKSTYYFSGSTNQAEFPITFPTPYNDDYLL